LYWTIILKETAIKKVLFFLASLALVASPLYPNNLSITNTRLIGRDISAGANNPANFVYVHFDVSWENSWRLSSTPGNWDAAWIFVKYRVGSGPWHHATLNGSGHVAPSGSTINTPSDGKGAFIYRSSNGTGTANFTGAELRWNYGADGVSDNAAVIVSVNGIEMVYVPQGSFYAGDGTITDVEGHFSQAGLTSPYQITGEGALTLGGTNSANLGNNDNLNSNSGVFPSFVPDDFSSSTTQTLPAAFPKGYNAFYCMKYELTQDQYVAFLNMLDGTQQANRISAVTAGHYMYGNDTQSVPNNRNGVRCKTAPVGSTPGEYGNDLNNNGVYGESDDGQAVSCNWNSWADCAAYLDWAGLRPMTELEFEKACRGDQTPVANEYAWGDTSIARSPYTWLNRGTISEGVDANYTTASGNVIYGYTDFPIGWVFIDIGPSRVGIFAANPANTGRMTSGATYYGIMELTGNNVERVIGLGNPTGRSFAGSHGNGELTTGGDADLSDWPGTTAVGVGRRGGRWSSNVSYDGKRVSDRSGINLPSQNARDYFFGIRGVRTSN
jgi:formylglycine-generating enzyme required for sulfatase activity